MVTSLLNDNDVLFGRGLGATQFRGTKSFQRLVKTRKEEYMALKSYKAKRAIADSIYDEITRRGGRFLSLVDTGEEIKNIVEEGEWEEVSKKAGLEKVKQALRERKWVKDDDHGAEKLSPIAESKAESKGDDEADDTSTQEAAENEESAERLSASAQALDSERPSLSSDEWDDSSESDSLSSDGWDGSSLPFVRASSLSPVPPRVLERGCAPFFPSFAQG